LPFLEENPDILPLLDAWSDLSDRTKKQIIELAEAESKNNFLNNEI